MQYMVQVKFGVEREIYKCETRREAEDIFNDFYNDGYEVRMYIY